mgnify:CR=1 FL=1
MTDAVIVSTARTGLGKSYRGALNNTHSVDLAGHVIQHAVQRAGIDPAIVEDVILGATFHEGAQGKNIARLAAIRAGLPVTTAGLSINRFCSSGLQSIAIAAQRVVSEKVPAMVAGGVESISMVQNEKLNSFHATNDWLMKNKPELYLAMIETADIVAQRYGVSRESQDEYALISQQRTAAAQEAGRFDDEIVPVTVKTVKGKTVVQHDQQPRNANPEKIPELRPAFREGGSVTAANSSSISDGAAALILIRRSEAEKKGLTPLAAIHAHATHAQDPEWFSTAPIEAVNKVLAKSGWKKEDVDLFEVNEAFAVVTMAAMRDLGLSHDKVNIHGGACALGHPVGASGARIVVTLLNALQKYDLSKGVASLCIGGGEATALAIERLH